MSFLSMHSAFSAISYFGDDERPLVPSVLHVPGARRADLSRLRVTGPAVYLALYADGIHAYVGVSGDYPSRAGESPHLTWHGALEQVFVITEAQDRWTLDEARAAERIVWESLNEVCGYVTLGQIPLGVPVADRYAQLRTFCGRALQIIAASGHALTNIPDAALLVGATGNSDILGDDLPGLYEGVLHEFVGKNIAAQAVEGPDGNWTLLAGSEVWSTPVRSAGQLVRVRHESLLYSGCIEPHPSDPRLLVTRRHLHFSSPSGAALFVAGSKGYGPAGWRRLCMVRNGVPGPLPRQP